MVLGCHLALDHASPPSCCAGVDTELLRSSVRVPLHYWTLLVSTAPGLLPCPIALLVSLPGVLEHEVVVSAAHPWIAVGDPLYIPSRARVIGIS